MNNIFSKNKNLYKKITLTKGFTLLELLISLTILSIVLVIGLGLLVTTNSQVRLSRTQRRVMDNVSFAMEHMSRAITYGHDYSCTGTPPVSSCGTSGTNILGFTADYLGTPTYITYTRQVSSSGRGYIARTVGGGNSVSLTDELVDINELTFYVYDTDPFSLNPFQPHVILVINGVSNGSGTPKPFFIQTTLSQRDLKLN